MRFHASAIVFVVFPGLVLVYGNSPAEQARQDQTPAAERGAVDVGVEAMRREALAKVREREEIFKRIEATRRKEALKLPARVDQRLTKMGLALPEGGAAIVWVNFPEPERDQAGGARGLPKPVVAPQTFDLLLVGNSAAALFVVRLDALLDKRIREAAQDRQLSPEVIAKLQLAGQGDIKHLLDQVETKRREFERARSD